MTINSNKLIFSLLTFMVTCYTSFSKISIQLPEPQEIPKLKTSKNYPMILKNKILLDIKHKTKTQVIIDKEMITLSVDREGKILGYTNVKLTKNNKTTLLNENNKTLKKSTLWGIMKLIKI
jgi:hypothetical protein